VDAETLLEAVRESKESDDARLVFGHPIVQADRTVVPVARIRHAFGWGFGAGSGERTELGSGEGLGGGRGGFSTARPVAIIEVGPDGAQVKPVPDVTRLALAAMLLIAWNVFWVTRTARAIYGRR